MNVNKILEIILSVILNVFLTFTVLSALYIFYTSRVETPAYETEIGSKVDTKIGIYLDEANASSQGEVAKTLKLFFQSNPNAQKIIESPTKNISKESNRWLFTSMYIVIGFLAFILFFFIAMSKLIAENHLVFWKKVLWTLLIFMFVGVVEAIFFSTVAKKFVPTPPSTVVISIIDTLKKW